MPDAGPDSLGDRLSRAEARVEALASFSEEASRLRRALGEAQGAAPGRADTLTEDLEARLRLAEDELRELVRERFTPPAGLPEASFPAPEAFRKAILDETVSLLRATFASAAFRDLAETAAREAGARAEAAVARLEARLAAVESSTLKRLEDVLRDERRQALLDLETLERQMASQDATLGTLQDRMQALESRPAQAPEGGSVEALRRELEARLAAVPTAEAVEGAVRRAGAALDAQLSERLAGLLAGQPKAGASDPAAFLQQIREMVQQAVAEAFPVDELGRIMDQKIQKRGEAMHAELREVEAALVKAIMQQLEGKPVGEAQVVALIDQRINQLLLKYIQR